MPVCITGMHRSGTSLVAKLMHESGLNLGPPAAIMPPDELNPEGYWEHSGFVALDEEILSRLGGGWDCPPPATSDWTGPALADPRSRAERLVAEFAGEHPWGWKDPRACLTLPFWQTVLDPLKVVLVVRNPLEVASSLRARNGFSFALGLTLWRISYERAMAAAPGRVVTHFDAYFSRPEAEIERIWTAAGLSPAATGNPRPDRADERLRHHRFSGQDLAAAEVDPSIRDLYAELCAEAEWTDDAPSAIILPGPVPGASTTGDAATVVLGAGGVNRAAVEAGLLRQALDELRDEYHHDIRTRDDQIDRMNTVLTLQEQDAAAARSAIAELEELRAATSTQTERLAQAERRLHDALVYEDDLRDQLVSAHQQLVFRDAEVMSTLGIALARHAPGAPAAIYYRQLLDRVRASVIEHLPPGAPVAVASMGDEAMLALDGRQAWHYPATEKAQELTYAISDTEELLAQLEEVRAAGAEFLLMPASSWSWSARYPKLNRWIETIYHSVVRDDSVCNIYDLRQRKPTAAGTV